CALPIWPIRAVLRIPHRTMLPIANPPIGWTMPPVALLYWGCLPQALCTGRRATETDPRLPRTISSCRSPVEPALRSRLGCGRVRRRGGRRGGRIGSRRRRLLGSFLRLLDDGGGLDVVHVRIGLLEVGVAGPGKGSLVGLDARGVDGVHHVHAADHLGEGRESHG